ncbi:MAG: helix-turn-helix domain-containing protein, partial [Bacteroidota bacterium]|nr:helix-turn-helix domain-containing protein [Bacteroidota bacterium]
MDIAKIKQLLNEGLELADTPVLIKKLQTVLQEISGLNELEEILYDVSHYTGVSIEAMKSKSRIEDIVSARYIFYAEARKRKASLQRIADEFDGHHSTVVYGLKQV